MRVPTIKLHKKTGQAYVNCFNTRVYLGKHGTDDANERYARVLSLIVSNASPQEVKQAASSRSSLTLGELLTYAKRGRGYSGWRVAEIMIQDAGLWDIPAATFRTAAFESFLGGCCELKKPDGNPYTTSTIRAVATCIRTAYKYGVKHDLVPPDLWHKLKACEIPRDKIAHTNPDGDIKPVPLQDYEKTIGYLDGVWRDTVIVLRYTGMRPGEAIRMSWNDIDDSDSVWVFSPLEHKTRHKGKKRRIYIGPNAQAILIKYRNNDPILGGHSTGPNEQVRRLRRKVRRACIDAGVTHWYPYQLRHTRGTELRKTDGMDAAQATLGHANISMTQVYAQRMEEAGRRSAAASG